jgi:protein SCO1/2
MLTARRRSTVSRIATWSLVLLGAAVVPAWAQLSAPLSAPPATAEIPILRDAAIDQKLDSQVPLDALFVDASGREVRLGEYFGARPVVLVLAYYGCPVLCTQVINGVASSMMPLSFDAGREFDVLVVSFDPGETPGMADAKRRDFLRRYARDGAASGVHFLTGRQGSIAALTDAVGFRYAYDESLDQWAHPAVVTVLTPGGRVSRYLFGIDYAPRDLRFALIEADEGRIGTAVDQALLFCYNYNPETGRYGFAIMTAVRIAGLVTLGGLGLFVLMALRSDRRRAAAIGSAATDIR